MEYTTFREFFKRFWWLVLVLGLLLAVSLFVFCIIFWSKLYDISAWASMIAGIFSYIGSSFLGIVVFYHSWIQVQIQEKKDEIGLNVEPLANYETDFFIPFKETSINTSQYCYSFATSMRSGKELQGVEFHYLQLSITNLTCALPVRLEIEGLYFVNSYNCVEKIAPCSVKSDFSFSSFMEFKQTATIYIGGSSEKLTIDYFKKHKYLNVFVVLRISTPTNQVKYLLVDYCLGKTLSIDKKIITESQYKKHCKKYGSPVVLTKYNKQFFAKEEKTNS